MRLIGRGEGNLRHLRSPNSDFVAISTGNGHSLGLKSDGSVVAWGYNNYGQCDVPSPNSDFVAISARGDHSLGLKSDGSIVAWGLNNYGQCDVPSPNSDFVAISAGGWYSLGLKSDGSIVAWGANDAGQCNVPSPNSDFVAISAGGYHNLGLKSDGSIVAWGYNGIGQCDVPSPNSDFVAISAGFYHNLGLKSDGSIVAWGYNGHGQCDIPSPNSDFVAMSVGLYHSIGLKSDGSIVAWGLNNYGQCDVPSPNSDFVAISAEGDYSLGLKSGVPSIEVATPNGGDTLYINTHFPIQWQICGQVPDYISIYLSLDSGVTYTDTLITGIPGTDTVYVWNVFNKPSNNARIKVSAWIDSKLAAVDYSNDDFIIKSAFSDTCWVDATNEATAYGERQNFGMSWSDFNNDGYVDLYVSGPGDNTLLYNQSGTFVVSDIESIKDNGVGRAAVWGDYDNDGYLDLFLANIGANKLYHNYNGIDFLEVSLEAFEASDATFGATWVDYDNDGDLDLYYVNAGSDTNKLLENIGDAFVRVQTGSPLEYVGECVGAAWGDYDNDGDQDVYLSNYGESNLLLQNVGGGQFVDVTNDPLGDTGNGKGAIWADFDNDGDLDLYVINFGSENKLLLNSGHNNGFVETPLPDQNGYLYSNGAAAGDYDNDGDIDLYVTVEGTNVLLSNQGNADFIELGSPVLADTSQGRAVAWGDYDNNGTVNWGAENKLIKNNIINQNHWIKVCLRGSVSNCYGIGARIRLVANGKGQIREIAAGEGYLSQSPLMAQFGLGDNTTIDSLIVNWPSGVVDILTSSEINVDEEITIHEGDYLTNSETKAPAITALYQCYPNPFNPSTTIKFSLATDQYTRLSIYDVSGRLVRVLVDGKMNSGIHRVFWDGKDTRGKNVSSGIYFYEMKTGKKRITKKMVLLR